MTTIRHGTGALGCSHQPHLCQMQSDSTARNVLSCAASRPWRTGLTPTREHPCPKLRTLSPSTPQGEKRYPAEWNGDNKRTFGRVNGCGIFLIGDPSGNTINLCEGVADALAIHQREPGTVIASLTTFTKLISHHSLIKHIAARNPVTFPDMDEAGKAATDKLTQALTRAGATVKIRQGTRGDDPADSARKESQ